MADDAAREDGHKPAGGAHEEEENRQAQDQVEGAGEDQGGGEAEPAPPPPDDEVAAAIVERFPGTVFDRSHGQPVVYVDPAVWKDLATFLRDEQQFTQCVDVTAVDHLIDAERREIPGVGLERFEVVANFLSHARNRRIRAIAELPAAEPVVASLVDVYPGVDFPEREVYDLLGVTFEGHPDLTRILMPDDWEGHPARKDYPVQVNVPVDSSMPLQMTEQEFVANIEATRVKTRIR
jgi:NADH-quinone oxidoreductase subunit C